MNNSTIALLVINDINHYRHKIYSLFFSTLNSKLFNRIPIDVFLIQQIRLCNIMLLVNKNRRKIHSLWVAR